MKTRCIVILALASTPICWAVQVTGDSANVGSGNTVPSASNSAAVGTNNAVGNGSLASGSYNSIGEFSFASGEWNVSNGVFTSAFGSGNGIDWMTGSLGPQSAGSSVFGNWNGIQNSEGTSALGNGNGIYGESGSFIAGTWNVIWSDQVNGGNAGNYGWSNVVLGNSNAINKTTNSINDSVLIGLANSTEVSQSWIFGEGNIGQTGTVTLGTYAATVSDASLIVGTGTGGGLTPRTNGLVVLKNGTVSIPSGVLQLGGESALTSTSAAPVMASYLTANNYLKKTSGWNSAASSSAICAFGISASATGSGSLSFGDLSQASGDLSLSIGPGSRATAWASIAIQGSAEAYQSVAIGPYTKCLGGASTAIGYGSNTTAEGFAGTAIGFNAKNNSGYSTAIGYYAEANGWISVALGNGAISTGRGSTSLGTATRANASYSVALGSANFGNQGNSWDWIESDPVFELGNSVDGNARSNAITTLKNGQTTLINKAWKANVAANPSQTLADPPATTTDSGGEALVVDGHTRLRGKVVIEQPQGDISMGIYGN